MDEILFKLLSNTFGSIGIPSVSPAFLEFFGSITERNYCLNWWFDEYNRRVEFNISTPIRYIALNYNSIQESLIKRFDSSKYVIKVTRLGKRRINVYIINKPTKL